MTRQLTIEIVEYMAYALAKEMMDWNEPIPPFNTRFPGRLESCLAAPFATHGGFDLYEGLIQKAAIQFYGEESSLPKWEQKNSRYCSDYIFVLKQPLAEHKELRSL